MSLARPIVRRVAAPFARGLTEPPLGGLDAAIAALFPDAWYDPSDLTTLYQDAAGTTPVTALEQPVGLILDKSRGLVLGSELVTNGDFSSGTTGWTQTSGNVGGSAVVNGEFNVVAGAGGSGGFTQDVTVVVGRAYRVSVTARKISGAGAVRFQTFDGASFTTLIRQFVDVSTVGDAVTYTATIWTTSTTTLRLYLFSAASTTGGFDNISVRELPGYHAFHTPGDTTTRPTVSRRINLLTKTEQFDDAAVWGVNGNVSIAANSTVAPDGTTSADTLTRGATNASESMLRVTTSQVANTSYTLSVYAKAGSAGALLYIRNLAVNGGLPSGLVTFSLSGDNVVTEGSAYTNKTSITPVGNGWYRCSIHGTTGASIANNLIDIGCSTNATAVIGTAGAFVYVWGASLVPADLAALPYQRVNTATDYDSDPSKFPTFLRCDGVNDSLQTNAIDFTGTDKMFVGAAVRKLSDASYPCVLEFSASVEANNGAFALFSSDGVSAGRPAWNWASRGTIKANVASPENYASPVTSVLSGIGDISGDSAILRANGAQVGSSSANQGTGNFGNHKLCLFMRGGTLYPFNGWFFGSLIKGATLSASQIALAERWLASKTKTVVL